MLLEWVLFILKEESRAMLLARINSLAKGCSAVKKILVDRMIFYLNHQIVPVIPEMGFGCKWRSCILVTSCINIGRRRVGFWPGTTGHSY